jgi:hypothetical protein
MTHWRKQSTGADWFFFTLLCLVAFAVGAAFVMWLAGL